MPTNVSTPESELYRKRYRKLLVEAKLNAPHRKKAKT